MRTWERARVDGRCGRCDGRIPATAPVLVILLPQLTAARRVRCRDCAGVPPDEAQLDAFDTAEERAAIVTDGARPSAWVQVGALRFDVKAAAAGRDE